MGGLHEEVGELVHARLTARQEPAQDDVVGVVVGDLELVLHLLQLLGHVVRGSHDAVVLLVELVEQAERRRLVEPPLGQIPPVEGQQVLVHPAEVEDTAPADLLQRERHQPDELERLAEGAGRPLGQVVAGRGDLAQLGGARRIGRTPRPPAAPRRRGGGRSRRGPGSRGSPPAGRCAGRARPRRAAGRSATSRPSLEGAQPLADEPFPVEGQVAERVEPGRPVLEPAVGVEPEDAPPGSPPGRPSTRRRRAGRPPPSARGWGRPPSPSRPAARGAR